MSRETTNVPDIRQHTLMLVSKSFVSVDKPRFIGKEGEEAYSGFEITST